MTKNISEKDILILLDKVKHPAINCTLRELGITKDVSIKDGKVLITMALPFPNIPIKDQLASSVREPTERLGAEVQIRYTVMTQEEREAFLRMEREGWVG